MTSYSKQLLLNLFHKFIIIFFFILFIPSISFSHSGGLNQQGCHNNNKTGGYHCHRSPSPSISKSYECKLTIGDQYFLFNPSNVNAKIKFQENNGEIDIIC